MLWNACRLIKENRKHLSTRGLLTQTRKWQWIFMGIQLVLSQIYMKMESQPLISLKMYTITCPTWLWSRAIPWHLCPGLDNLLLTTSHYFKSKHFLKFNHLTNSQFEQSKKGIFGNDDFKLPFEYAQGSTKDPKFEEETLKKLHSLYFPINWRETLVDT